VLERNMKTNVNVKSYVVMQVSYMTCALTQERIVLQ